MMITVVTHYSDEIGGVDVNCFGAIQMIGSDTIDTNWLGC